MSDDATDAEDGVGSGRRPHIALVTCRTWPDLSVSDMLLAEELERRGCVVTARPWNDAPLEDFVAADVIVFRSNWDYHHEITRFGEWLDAIAVSGCVVLNPIDLVRSTIDKGAYLDRLARAGVPIPLTLPVQLAGAGVARPGDTIGGMVPDPTSIAAWADAHRLDRLVLKPSYGASGHAVDMVARAVLESACHDRVAETKARPFLVQEFLAQIADGEVSLVFFEGSFSHAFRRTPSPTDFRVNGGHGGTTEPEIEPTVDLIDFATNVLATFPITPTFIRIDVVGSVADDLRVMEVEINEPALGLHLAPGSDVRFADAVMGALPPSVR